MGVVPRSATVVSATKSRCEHADEQEQQTKRQMCKAARGANGCLAGHWRHEENGQSKEKSRRVSALKTEMIYRIENIEMLLGESVPEPGPVVS